MTTTTQTAQYVASATASGREGRAVTSDGRNTVWHDFSDSDH